MQQNPKDILLAVLEIIDYEDDKEAFTNEFIATCEKKAYLDLIATLPPEHQEEIKQELKGTAEAEQISTTLVTYLPPQAYTRQCTTGCLAARSR